jgi:hypothetical protein
VVTFIFTFRNKSQVVDLGRYSSKFKEDKGVNELSCWIINAFNDLGIHRDQVMSFCCDSDSTNLLALKGPMISFMYKDALKLQCMVHTLSHCPEHMIDFLPDLKSFWLDLLEILRFSTKVIESFDLSVGINLSFSRIRFLSMHDAMRKAHVNLPVIVSWILEAQKDFKLSACMGRLVTMVSNDLFLSSLNFEFSLLLEIGKVFRDPCYQLEGSYPVGHLTYDAIEAINTQLDMHGQDMTFDGLSDVIGDDAGLLQVSRIML